MSDETKKTETQLPNPNTHANDPAGREPTAVPDSKVHVIKKPEPTAVADDAMSGATSAQ